MKNLANFMFLLMILITIGCGSNIENESKNDTIEIFQTILSSNDFISEIPGKNDTIHFLKNDFTNESWPDRIGRLSLRFIADTGTARSKNGRWLPDEINDERLRYEVKTFDVSPDSAYVMIYQYNFVEDCHYKLKKEDNKWVITLASCGSE